METCGGNYTTVGRHHEDVSEEEAEGEERVLDLAPLLRVATGGLRRSQQRDKKTEAGGAARPAPKHKMAKDGFVEVKRPQATQEGQGAQEAEEGSAEEWPGERYGHTAVVEERGGGVLLVWGGSDPLGNFLHDLWHYNFESKKWGKIEADGAPPGRHFHSAVIYEGRMYIYGGTSNGYYTDLHCFDLNEGRWSVVLPANKPPSPRYGHSAVVHRHFMYVFGGYDKDGFECNDLYEFNFFTQMWRKIKTKGVIPKDRYHHTAVVHAGSMYVFGGKKSFNEIVEYRFSTETWSLVQSEGSGPRPRWGHGACVWRGGMWIFAGRDNVFSFKDLFVFHFESGRWQRMAAEGISERAYHSLVAYGDHLYSFAGCNIFHFCFNDLHVYSLIDGHGGAPNTLVDDFKNLLDDASQSDITFVFPQEANKTISAHKNILAARCAPMQALLRSGTLAVFLPHVERPSLMQQLPPGMREAYSGVVTIDSIDYATFYALLEFLYTGQVFVQANGLVSLLLVADQYQLERLKSLCEQKIIGYVDSENVTNMLLLSEQVQAPDLAKYTVDYIAKNWASTRHETGLGQEHIEKIERRRRRLSIERHYRYFKVSQ